jgi:transcriptional regulator with XRE-family HTH domain
MQQVVGPNSNLRPNKESRPKSRPSKEQEMSHNYAGEKLVMLRRKRNLKFLDVQTITRQIAGRHGLAEYAICPSRLKGIENGEIPSLYKLYSLSIVYEVPIDILLSWYGVPPAMEEGDLRLAERLKREKEQNCSERSYADVA